MSSSQNSNNMKSCCSNKKTNASGSPNDAGGSRGIGINHAMMGNNNNTNNGGGRRCNVCRCANCTCEDPCQCSETLCQCAASAVMDSVKPYQKVCCKNDYDNKKKKMKKKQQSKNQQKQPTTPTTPPPVVATNASDPLAGAATAETIAATGSPPTDEDSTRGETSHSTDGGSDIILGSVIGPGMSGDDGVMVYNNKVELWIEGMTCSMCAQAIENAVKGIMNENETDPSDAGSMKITNCSVSLSTDTAVVEWNRRVVVAALTPDTPASIGSGGVIVEQQQQQQQQQQQMQQQQTPNVDDDVEAIQDAIEAIGYTVEQVLMLSSTKSSANAKRSPSKSARGGSATTTPTNRSGSRNHNNNSSSNNNHNFHRTSTGGSSSNSSSNNRNNHYRNNVNGNATSTTATATFESIDARWERLVQRQQAKVLQRKMTFLWSLVGTIPVLIETMVLPHILPNIVHFLQEHHIGCTIPIWNRQTYISIETLLLWMFATPVQFICGLGFYKATYHNLRSGRAGMDVLVALGTTASYVYALYGGVFSIDKGTNSGGGGGSSATNPNGCMQSSHFFETSVTLISFVLAGKWMQAMAVRKTSQALTHLMKLQPRIAIKVTPFKDRQNFHPLKDPYMETTVAIEDVKEGDLVKIVMGSSIPADGRVVFGEVAVDESMITGESMPILKTAGSLVLGGTLCVETNITGVNDTYGTSSPSNNASLMGGSPQTPTNTLRGRLRCQRDSIGAAFVHVTGVGSQTALAQIVQLVQDAQTRSVPIQNFADNIASIFVPTVCAISLLTYLVWYALCSAKVVPEDWYKDLGEDPATFSIMFGIAVLVVSCPCALGLATPIAFLVGTGVGANIGVLIKGGEALQIASKVDSVVFDKTGTLTCATPAITDFFQLDDPDVEVDEGFSIRDHLLWLFASLERTSEHPLAKAVVSYTEKKIDQEFLRANPFAHPSDFHALTGRGASGIIDGEYSVAIGNRAFATFLEMKIPRTIEECMVSLEDEGKTAILAAVNGKVCVVMGVADQLKPDASSTITYLKGKLGVDVWLVTGDNPRTANALSRKLGLPSNRVISEALPSAKVQHVRKLQRKGHIVAMVGDGVNDSPALAQADIGISVGTGAKIACEASDMVLVKGDCRDVCTALDLSRTIFRRIQWNLLWSLLYNCLGIPIAAGCFYPLFHTRLPPSLAAMAMALSSISVVLSSLSLRLYQPPDRNYGHSNVGHLGSRCSLRAVLDAIRRRILRQSLGDDDDLSLTADLLENDNLTSENDQTESTRCIDNRSIARMEAGELQVSVSS